jgi:hypothetical protein
MSKTRLKTLQKGEDTYDINGMVDIADFTLEA